MFVRRDTSATGTAPSDYQRYNKKYHKRTKHTLPLSAVLDLSNPRLAKRAARAGGNGILRYFMTTRTKIK